MSTAHTPWHPGGRALTTAFAILLLARTATAAPTYDGHLTLPGARLGGASATLDVVTTAVTGTLTISASTSPASGDYTVTGKQKGVRLVVKGTSAAGTKVMWTCGYSTNSGDDPTSGAAGPAQNSIAQKYLPRNCRN